MSDLRSLCLLLAASLLWGCEGQTVVEPSGIGGANSSSSATGSSTGGAGASGGCTPVVCPDDKTHDCGDCQDNDNDGLIDLEDPECADPCHPLDFEDIDCQFELECHELDDCPNCNCVTGCCVGVDGC